MEDKLRNKVIEAAKEYYKYKQPNKSEFEYIPPSGKLLDETDLSNMIDASLDMWLTCGRFNEKFEKEFAQYLNIKYCLTTNSGSSANLLALTALTSHKLGERKLNKGDEVISVATGFPTTINPIIQLGLIPVFIDCDVETCNIKIKDIEKAISTKTKAIMLAHTMGNPYDAHKIKSLCEKYNLWFIEDACDAFGAKINNEFVGTIGDIGTYSFYPAHIITMGEGGALTTNNPLLRQIIRSFRDWGRDCWCETGLDNSCNCRFSQQFGQMPFGYDHKYIYSHMGYNLKITDWQAAIGCSQLKKVDKFIAQRKNNFELLYTQLSDLQEHLILPEKLNSAEPAWFGFLISVKENSKFTKQQMVEFLENNGIGTRQLFGGNILRQPYFTENKIALRISNNEIQYSNKLCTSDFQKLPNTEYIMNNTFWVGVFPALKEKEIKKISDTIHQFIKNCSKTIS